MKWRPDPTEANDRDLGFGSEVATRARRRWINPRIHGVESVARG